MTRSQPDSSGAAGAAAEDPVGAGLGYSSKADTAAAEDATARNLSLYGKPFAPAAEGGSAATVKEFVYRPVAVHDAGDVWCCLG